MRKSVKSVINTFELTDGRELRAEMFETTFHGNYSSAPEDCYPDEHEYSEPEFYLDDEPIDVRALPDGLDLVAYVLTGECLPEDVGPAARSRLVFESEGLVG